MLSPDARFLDLVVGAGLVVSVFLLFAAVLAGSSAVFWQRLWHSCAALRGNRDRFARRRWSPLRSRSLGVGGTGSCEEIGECTHTVIVT